VVVCDNLPVTQLRPVVLLILLRLLALLGLAAASGCEQVNDMPRLQDEALEVAKAYQGRFDELTRRADAIRPEQLGAADARSTYGQARETLDQLRNELRQVPLTVKEGAKSGHPEVLQKLIATMRARFEAGVIDTTWKLAAVESWVAMAEHPGGGPPPAASPPEPVPDEPPPGDPGSPAPDR
jgi:hypothetical protein